MGWLYVVRQKGKDLVYAGKIDPGFDKTSAAELRRRLTPFDPQNAALAHRGV
jgi:bifunctional non-homologous end joining protein LigD